MGNKAKAIVIDNDDVVVSSSNIVVATPIVISSKPAEQPIDETSINVGEFRKAITKQFTGSRAVIDHILSLNLTSESKDDIEKLRVVFYDTWPELSYGKLGQTSKEAIKSREALYSTKSADRDDVQRKIYDATKSAWMWVKQQCDLKAPPKAREPNSGTGKSAESEAEGETMSAQVDDFEKLAKLALDIAKLIDMATLSAVQAKVKSSGLITSMRDVAKALRVSVQTSKEGLK